MNSFKLTPFWNCTLLRAMTNSLKNQLHILLLYTVYQCLAIVVIRSTFETIYLRPTNGRADDQLRRNHSVQYFAYPEYPWHRLRDETPGMYETYVDLVPGEWTRVKIEVSGEQARLYVHDAEQPVLVVNDLKLGNSEGAIGLWIGPGTDAYFADLSVTANN